MLYYSFFALCAFALLYAACILIKAPKTKNDSDSPIIRERFPKILADRIIKGYVRSGYLVPTKPMENWRFIINFNWRKSQEGFEFWEEICELYQHKNQPSSEEILSIFKKYDLL